MGKAIATFVLVFAVLYGAICAYLYTTQRDLIYFGQVTTIDAAGTDYTLKRPDATLRGWVVNPGQADAVVYFGGNAERIEGLRSELASALPGRTVYLVAYRGYGASTGEPSEAVIAPDAIAVFDDVRKRHPGGRIAVVGRSLGSGVAAHVAGARPVDRIVLVTPFDSMVCPAAHQNPLVPVRWMLEERWESAKALATLQAPALVLRAGRDEVVPAACTDALLAALPKAPRVEAFPEANHDDISDDPRYWQSLIEFLR